MIRKEHPKYLGYLVSDEGTIYSTYSHRNLSTHVSPYGYECVGITYNKRSRVKLVSHMVLETFVGPKTPSYHAAHLDGDKLNNRLDNLNWVSPKDNAAHKKLHGTDLKGTQLYCAKICDRAVIAIRRLRVENKWTTTDIAALFDMNATSICNITRGKSWRHVGGPINVGKILPDECKRGHPYSPENIVMLDNGRRRTRNCKICFERREKIKSAKRRAQSSRLAEFRKGKA